MGRTPTFGRFKIATPLAINYSGLDYFDSVLAGLWNTRNDEITFDSKANRVASRSVVHVPSAPGSCCNCDANTG